MATDEKLTNDTPQKPKKGKRGGARPGGGRKKGIPNRISRTAKENIVAVFIKLGGTNAMKRWALKNQTEFYRIYAKLLPVELSGADGGAIKFEATERDSVRAQIVEAFDAIEKTRTPRQVH